MPIVLDKDSKLICDLSSPLRYSSKLSWVYPSSPCQTPFHSPYSKHILYCYVQDFCHITLSIASLVPPLLKPHRSLPRYGSALLSNLRINIFNTIFDARRDWLSRNRHILALHSSFRQELLWTPKKSSGHSPHMYISLHISNSSLFPAEPKAFRSSAGMPSGPVAFLFFSSSKAFSNSL